MDGPPQNHLRLSLALLVLLAGCSYDVSKLRAPSRVDSGTASDVAREDGGTSAQDAPNDPATTSALDGGKNADGNVDGTPASIPDGPGSGEGGRGAIDTGTTDGTIDVAERDSGDAWPGDAPLESSVSDGADLAGAPDVPAVEEDVAVQDAVAAPDSRADGMGANDGNDSADGAGDSGNRDSATSPDGPSQGSGGAVGSGGTTGTGGATGAGGTTNTGGATGAGGAGGCDATPSTVSRTYSFATGLGSLVPNYDSAPAAHLAFVTAGPASNPALCSPMTGCAALSVPYSAGTSALAGWVTAYTVLSPLANLVGATVTLSIAVDNPGGRVPIQVMAFATGDASTNYSQAVPTTVGGSDLTAYAPSAGFNTISMVVTDHAGSPGLFCASDTAFIGLEVQNTSAITSANAGTVTAYIRSMTVTPPP